ncbi:MAG: histidine kinase [Bacteroidota bacterium]
MSSLLPWTLSGQYATYYFNHLTTNKGLISQNYNYYLNRDAQGFMWISSADGVSRYDGKTIKNYYAGTKNSISNPTITSNFYKDKNQNIWFSTSESIEFYQPKIDKFKGLSICWQNRAYISSYYLMHIDNIEEKMWFRVRDTLFTSPLNAMDIKADSMGVYPLNIRSKIIPTTKGHLLLIPLSQRNGLYIHLLSKEQKQPEDLSIHLKDFDVTDFFVEDEFHCLVGTDKGLVLLNMKTGSFQLFDQFNGQKINNIQDLVSDGSGKLIVATRESGIFFFNKARKEFEAQMYRFDGEETFAFKPIIERIHIDQDRTLWVSTKGRGIFYTNLDKRRFQVALQTKRFQKNEKKISSFIKSITEDSKGNIWCLTAKGIAITDSHGNEKNVLTEKVNRKIPFRTHEPYFIHCDNDDNIWVATQEGAYLMKSGSSSFIKVPVENKGHDYSIAFTHIEQVATSKILLSSVEGIYEAQLSYDGFLLKKIIGNKERFTWIHELPERKIVLFRNIEKYFHVYRYDEANFTPVDTIEFAPFVNYMVNDASRNLTWIATPEGLYTISSDFLIEKQFFPTSIINSVLIHKKTNFLWVGSSEGILCYNPDSIKWKTYDISDGLQAEEFNFWSAKKMKNGKMVFGGVNGINLFEPDSISTFDLKVNPKITAIEINNLPVTQPLVCLNTGATNPTYLERIRLARKDNAILFRFSALDYSNPDANLYKYKLIGRDKDWVDAAHENFARYADLSYGDYTFVLQATNSDGDWSNKTATLQITIPPPIYLTSWFLILSAIVSLLIIYSLIRFRFKQLRKKLATANKIAHLQKQEAELKQAKAETEKAVLRLQMNPHFIFNSMNSIISYILKKEIDTAYEYLQNFAKLMRMVLDSSEQPFTVIEEEIELLTLYLDAENMRLGDKLKYEFIVHSNVDVEEVLIPTMILQPFIENAIWHGISPKKDKEGLIQIRFEIKDNLLLCEVEDNGVGRSYHDSTHPSTHKSKALSITKRRLALLSEEVATSARYEIEDLYDEQKNPCGTLVRLFLPLLDED